MSQPLRDLAINAIFPTFLYARDHPDAATLNPRLAELAHAMRLREPQGRNISNRNGWQSTPTFGKDPACRALIDFIERTMVDVKSFLSVADHIDFRVASMWANINGHGGYNTIHIHGNAFFSGVYYVSAPQGAGHIEFREPSHIREYHSMPFKEMTERNCFVQAYAAIEGRLYIFPGYLPHAVTETTGSEERISVSFNISAAL